MPDWYGEYDAVAEAERIAKRELEQHKYVKPIPWWEDLILFLCLLTFVGLFIWPINLPLMLVGFVIKPDQMDGWIDRLFLWVCMTFLLMLPVGFFICFLVFLWKAVIACYRRVGKLRNQ